MKHGIVSIFGDGHIRDYSKNQIILYQGEKTHDVFYIESGFIKVYDITTQGIEKLILILGPGDVFPLLWTFRNVSALHYFYETINEAELKVIDCEVFIERVKKEHTITLNMLKYFVDTTKELMSRIDCIEASNAKRKVIQVLSYLVEAHGMKSTKNMTKIEIPLTHQMIANMAGVTRETASIQLKELEKQKLLVIDDNVYLVYINQIDKLLDAS